MNLVAVLVALGQLCSDAIDGFMAILKPGATLASIISGLIQLAPKLQADWQALMDALGRDQLEEVLNRATHADYVEAEKVLMSGRRDFTWPPDGKWLKLLLKYGPVIYNFLAAILGWPPLPPIPIPEA